MTRVEARATACASSRSWQSARVLLVVVIVLVVLVATGGCALTVDWVGDRAGDADGHAGTRIPPVKQFAAQGETPAPGLYERELGSLVTALPVAASMLTANVIRTEKIATTVEVARGAIVSTTVVVAVIVTIAVGAIGTQRGM